MRMAPATTVILLFVFVLAGSTTAHNITTILDKHPEFSTFNHYLTITHLAGEVNRRSTLTVLAIDNGAMDALLNKNPSIGTIKNVLSLHIIADYWGTKKLHQIDKGSTRSASLYQATGKAPGTTGYVNITDLGKGKVGFGAVDSGSLDATFVKSILEMPYYLSVIQISDVLTSPEAEAPAPSVEALNLTELLSAKSCKTFSDLLSATGTIGTFTDNMVGGLTVFCPVDTAFAKFMPTYKNLTNAKKAELILYHGIALYENMQMLKTNNGPYNTLATNKANFAVDVQNDGEVVTLKTKVVTGTITGTLYNEEPVIVYTLDKVLQPPELFAVAPSPSPAESPTKKKNGTSPLTMPGPDEAPADVAAADHTGGAVGRMERWSGGLVVGAAMVAGLMITMFA